MAADGLCRIDIILPKPTIQAYATGLELGLAGARIIQDCVDSEPLYGGIAQHVGESY